MARVLITVCLMKTREIMTPGARCVGPEETLVEAARVMRDLDVGALPVWADDRVRGMVTDRDITVRAIAESLDPSETSVGMVMSPEISWIYDDQDVEDAAHVMEVRQIRRLPVLDRTKRLVGMISLGDLASRTDPELAGGALREISEPSHPTIPV
jgi:CBS domain-containing protein